MTARQALEQELSAITYELGEAFIASKPKPHLAQDARTIQAFLALANRRPGVAAALSITLAAPAPLTITVPEQATPAEVVAELGAIVDEARHAAAIERRAEVAPTHAANHRSKRADKITTMVEEALRPSSADLTVEPVGEITARRQERLRALRQWAIATGLQVSGRGSLSQDVINAYRLARELEAKREAAPAKNTFRPDRVTVLGGGLKTQPLPGTSAAAIAGECRHPRKIPYTTPTEARLAAEEVQAKHTAEQPNDQEAAQREVGVYRCGTTAHYHWGHKLPWDRDPAISIEEEGLHNIEANRRANGTGASLFVSAVSA